MVHEVARLGFGQEAEVYERTRPGYPPAAVAWLVARLGLGPGVVAADLAAGTGKLTRLLVPTGAAVVAVEPVAAMREVLRRLLPGRPAVAGAAEALPFRASSLDAVTAAQAFHWFDADAAFEELRRVVRPGGGVGLVWNARDRSADWLDRAWAVMDRVEKRAPWRDHDRSTGASLGRRPGFGPGVEATFSHVQECTPGQFVERIQGVSHVAVLPPTERDAVLAEVADLLATHPDTRGQGRLAVPYRVDCWWYQRR